MYVAFDFISLEKMEGGGGCNTEPKLEGGG